MAIQKSFTDCTVLTIAHRLETVINTNRILVMEDGCAVVRQLCSSIVNCSDSSNLA